MSSFTKSLAVTPMKDGRNWKLYQLRLIIKQSLKFLDTLCFSFKQQKMFFIRQYLKICRSVITLNSVQMMDYPSLWHWFAMNLFPNKDMFKNITTTNVCSRVARIINTYITPKINPTTFPIVVVFTFSKKHRIYYWVSFPPNFQLARITSQTFRTTRFATIYTRMLTSLTPFLILFLFIFRSIPSIFNHIYIVSHYHLNYKYIHYAIGGNLCPHLHLL